MQKRTKNKKHPICLAYNKPLKSKSHFVTKINLPRVKYLVDFRKWATQTLNEFIIKGFVLDDERLKQGKNFGQDFFDELLERIREIIACERRFYQKIHSHVPSLLRYSSIKIF